MHNLRGIKAEDKDSSQEKEKYLLILTGTSCAGKSSFRKRLEKETKGEWICLEDDLITYDLYVKEIAKRFPEEHQEISKAIDGPNLFHAYLRDDVQFKKELSEETKTAVLNLLKSVQYGLDGKENLGWKEALNQEVRAQVQKVIEKGIAEGKKVLIDTWYFDQDSLQKIFPNRKVVSAVLYCPLELVLERLRKRNADAASNAGNLQEKRYFDQVITSFCKLYGITNIEQGSLGNVEKKGVEAIFNSVRKELKGKDFNVKSPDYMFKELLIEELDAIQKGFMEPFETFNNEYLFLAPKKKYDVIINTTEMDSKEVLELFLKFGDKTYSEEIKR